MICIAASLTSTSGRSGALDALRSLACRIWITIRLCIVLRRMMDKRSSSALQALYTNIRINP